MFKHTRKLCVLFVVESVFTGCGRLCLAAGNEPGTSPDTSQETSPKKPQKTHFIFGSSVEGSYGYLCLEAMCNVLNKHVEGIKFSAISSNGGAENIALLFNGEIDAGHTNNADILMAYTGQEPFKEKLEPIQLSSHGALTQIVAVRADSDINSIYDLEGKKVILGPPGAGGHGCIKLF